MRRHAHFIWTPRQKIDYDVTFRSLLVGGAIRRDEGVNRWFLFRRCFDLPQVPSAATLRIFADSRYQLFVNGVRVGRGPGRASPAFARVDEYDLKAALQSGTNVVAVLVHVYGVDTAWYETVKDYTQSIFGDGGLYVYGEFRCDNRMTLLASDESWRVVQCAAWKGDAPRSGWGQGFIEDHDARKIAPDWMHTSFDDTDWDAAQPQLRVADDLDRAKGWGDIQPFPTLLTREIAHMAEREVQPVRVISVNGVAATSSLPLERRIYEEPFEAIRSAVVNNEIACLTAGPDSMHVQTSPDQDVSLLIEFPRRHAGYPFIEVEALGGEVFEVAVAETVPGEYVANRAVVARVSRESYLDCAQLFRYVARPGVQRFEKFDWTGVKFLQLAIRNAPAGVRVIRVGSVETHYPVKNEGRFECSDVFLNQLWIRGRYTTLHCTHDAWEDCPGREKRQWLGDGIVHFLIDAAAFGSSSQAVDRQFLRQAAESQRTDGLLQMFAPGDHHNGGVIIPDFNLHWICAARHYLLHTGDVATIAQILPAVQRSLAWFERQSDQRGLMVDVPHWHFIEWARVGRSGESFAINALLVGALQAAVVLAEAVGYDRVAVEYRQWSERVRSALRLRHFDHKREVFVDSVDPASGRQLPNVSQQSNALARLFGIAEPEEVAPIVARIMDESLLRRTATPPVTLVADPFDPTTDVVRCNTYFSHFLYAALGKAGRFDLAVHDMRRLYGDMLATGTETLWESIEPVASLCHAFSATPVYQLSAHVLGVSPLAPGFTVARVAPQCADLAWARGAYPTPWGPLEVEWSRVGLAGRIQVRLGVPSGVTVRFVAPAGWQREPASGEYASDEITAGSHTLQVVPCGSD